MVYIIAQFHDQTKSRKSKNGESLNGSIPLMSNHDKELFTVTEVGNIVKNIVEEDQHKKMQPKEKVKVILEGISLYFNPGHLVAIMGPSGELYSKAVLYVYSNMYHAVEQLSTCNIKST